MEAINNFFSIVLAHLANGCPAAATTTIRNDNCIRNTSTTSSTSIRSMNPTSNGRNNKNNFDNDYTVLSGVVIDWGHGWGWGQVATQAACSAYETGAISSALYSHAAEDCGLGGGYNEVDWSAFGDFSF